MEVHFRTLALHVGSLQARLDELEADELHKAGGQAFKKFGTKGHLVGMASKASKLTGTNKHRRFSTQYADAAMKSIKGKKHRSDTSDEHRHSFARSRMGASRAQRGRLPGPFDSMVPRRV